MKIGQSVKVTVSAFLFLTGAMNSDVLMGETKKPMEEAKSYAIVPAKSEVRWTGKKVTGSHNGTVEIQTGKLTVENGQLTAGTVVLDMSTIKDLDIKNPETNAKLIGHLKSADFFDVENHPTATFTITEVSPLPNAKVGENNVQLTGRLDVKNMSHPASFRATVVISKNMVKASATNVKIDRTLYDIRYGSGKFFENLGDKVIDDNFTIDFDVVAAPSK